MSHCHFLYNKGTLSHVLPLKPAASQSCSVVGITSTICKRHAPGRCSPRFWEHHVRACRYICSPNQDKCSGLYAELSLMLKGSSGLRRLWGKAV